MGGFSAKIRARLSRRAIYGIVLLLIFGIALSLRVCLPYEVVFGGDWVRFGGNDPWYHMRLVENLVQHFPHRIAFEPYTLYPSGQAVPFAPFFDLLLGFFIWVIGLGNPSPHTIETVGAYFPAILGALVTIPVYFIGRELFNRNVGLLAAGLIAILPGEFLFRSLLGFTDHHIAEVLFSTIMVLFLILAIKSAKEKEASFSHIWSRDWKNLRKPLIYALLAGFVLGIYLLSWIGGVLFVFIIFVYMLIQYIIDHLRGKSTDYLCIVGMPIFLIALVMVIPFLNVLRFGDLALWSLLIAVLAVPVLSGISWLMAYGKIERAYDPVVSSISRLSGVSRQTAYRVCYPLTLVVLGLVGLGFFHLIEPSLLSSMLGRFSLFVPSVTKQTIAEAQPLFSMSGVSVLWYYFTTDIFLALIALGLLIYYEVKEGSSDKAFLVIWCVIMLAATLGQRRFAYYFAVNVALLSGYLSWRILEWSWSYVREALPQREKRKRKAAKRKKPERRIRGYLSARYAWVAVVAVIVFFLAFFPNIWVAKDMVPSTWGPNEDWHSALVWMGDNTPDPFEDPDFYYEYEGYKRPPAGERYDYPESAYGVMSWWDYGHWITRIAHRIPNANPFQKGIGGSLAGTADAGTKNTLANTSLIQKDDFWNGCILDMVTGDNAGQSTIIVDFDAASDTLTVDPAFDQAVSAGDEYVIIRPGASTFFTAQDEASANRLLDELDSKYVVIDAEMATPLWKFHVMPTWAGKDQDEFFKVYYVSSPQGELEPILLYHPGYYKSMCSRLYNFGGEAVVPANSTLVISYQDLVDERGNKYKVITDLANDGKAFATYEEAEAFVDDHPDYIIVGLDPFVSPVPLEELEHYELVHEPAPTWISPLNRSFPYVRIFKYSP